MVSIFGAASLIIQLIIGAIPAAISLAFSEMKPKRLIMISLVIFSFPSLFTGPFLFYGHMEKGVNTIFFHGHWSTEHGRIFRKYKNQNVVQSILLCDGCFNPHSSFHPSLSVVKGQSVSVVILEPVEILLPESEFSELSPSPNGFSP